jgi:hypothetical protein
MDSFAQILRRLPTCDTSSSSGGSTHFKVHINFYIPIFEGQIDANVVDKWLNQLEGYFLSITFPIKKRLCLRSSKPFPMSNIGGRLSMRKRKQRNPHYLQSHSPGSPLGMLLKNNTTLLEFMMTCIQDGPHCDRKGTKQCQSSQISFIPCTLSWVSNILSDIWCSSTTTVCIDTSKNKWIFWTSCPWLRLIDMLSKSSKSLKKRRENLGLGTSHNRSRERETPSHRTKGRVNMESRRTTSLSCKQRRRMER